MIREAEGRGVVMLAIAVTVGFVAVVALCAVFGVQHHLDDKADRLSHGDETDREYAREMREVSRKMDQGGYLPF